MNKAKVITMIDTVTEMVKHFNLKFEPIDKSREEVLEKYSGINYDIFYDLAYTMWSELPKTKQKCFIKEDWLATTEFELLDGITAFYEVAPDELYFFDKYTYALILKSDSDPNKFIVGVSKNLDFTRCSCIIK